ncbi:MAG: hypothetical protein GF328_08985 [Candidatus Latescibacteria bacterium]|nr:hypothetical protein [Candidatus Latescibacterota bacterium]
MGVSDDEEVAIEAGGWTLHLKVRLAEDLPRGAAGIPAGLPGMPTWIPAHGRIAKR